MKGRRRLVMLIILVEGILFCDTSELLLPQKQQELYLKQYFSCVCIVLIDASRGMLSVNGIAFQEEKRNLNSMKSKYQVIIIKFVWFIHCTLNWVGHSIGYMFP